MDGWLNERSHSVSPEPVSPGTLHRGFYFKTMQDVLACKLLAVGPNAKMYLSKSNAKPSIS